MKYYKVSYLAFALGLFAGGLGSASAQDANGLGTALSNGMFYERTTANPTGLIDPGISVINPVAQQTSMLLGSSMRLQGNSGGFSGITTHGSCVNNAILSTPDWGGSGRGYWDVDAGIVPDMPTADFSSSSNNSFSACWLPNWAPTSGGANTGYEFSFTADFAPNTQLDGVYWEILNTDPTGGSTNNTAFQIYVDGVAVGGNVAPFSIGDPQSSDTGSGGVFDLEYRFGAVSQILSGVHTISLVGIGPDFIMGDIALMGVSAVPEPSSALLGLVSILTMATRRRR